MSRPATRRDYLAAMGVPVYRLRAGEDDRAPAPEPSPVGAAARTRAGPAAAAPARGMADEQVAARTMTASGAPDQRIGGAAEPAGAGVSGLDWEALESAVAACTACALHETRTQTVFGVGRRDADLMVIGEAPGADEDRQGEPFVGRAGQLLNAMLRGIGLAREQVFIANILKCRPPQNRDPRPEEAASCTGYLDRQVELVAPRAILAVGRISAQWLVRSDAPVGRLRGSVHAYGQSQIPVVVTYHPAYLLRTPLAKAKSWQDLLLVRELLSSEP